MGFDPQFFAEQLLNSLQFAMLLFLLAIGLSVIFGLMEFVVGIVTLRLCLSHVVLLREQEGSAGNYQCGA